jgi:hypothetical protein
MRGLRAFAGILFFFLLFQILLSWLPGRSNPLYLTGFLRILVPGEVHAAPPNANTGCEKILEKNRPPGPDAGNEVVVLFENGRLQMIGGDHEVFILRIDPALANQDGTPSDMSIIATLPATPITPEPPSPSMRPSAAFETEGNVHIVYCEDHEAVNPPRGNLLYRLVAPSGVNVIEKVFTDQPSATTTTELTLLSVAVHAQTCYIVWTYDSSGQPGGRLRIIRKN